MSALRSRVRVLLEGEDPRYAVLPVIDGLERDGFTYRRREADRMVLTAPTATVWLTHVTATAKTPASVVVDAWGVTAEQLVEYFVAESLTQGPMPGARVFIEGAVASLEVAVAA